MVNFKFSRYIPASWKTFLDLFAPTPNGYNYSSNLGIGGDPGSGNPLHVYLSSGQSVKIVDADDVANYVEISKGGSFLLNGTTTTWDDIRVPLDREKVTGAHIPTYSAINGTGVNAYQFADGDEVFFTVELPHDWKVGSTIYPHVHWMPTTDVSPAKNIKVNLEYRWLSIGSTFTTTTTVSRDISTGENSAFDHLVNEFPVSGIDGTGQLLSSLLCCRFFRSAADSDNYGDPVFVMNVDFHYEKDAIGSSLRFVK